jgi:hypothetical protein
MSATYFCMACQHPMSDHCDDTRDCCQVGCKCKRGAAADAPAEMVRAWRDLDRRVMAEEITTTKAAELFIAEFVSGPSRQPAPLAQPTPAQNVKIGYWQDGKTVAWVQVHTPEATLTIGENALAKIVRMSAAAGSTGVPPTVLEAEMVKQASLGHTQFMVGVHEWMGEGDEVIQGQEEWIPWADAFAKLLAGRSPAEVPPTDTERLNWLERFILDNKTDGHLFCYAGDLTCPTDECYLEVDGEAVGQAPTIREAIDAAMQSAGRVEERPTT